VPSAYWNDRFRKIRAGGYNAVQVFVQSLSLQYLMFESGATTFGITTTSMLKHLVLYFSIAVELIELGVEVSRNEDWY
jgi:hypothetical protein